MRGWIAVIAALAVTPGWAQSPPDDRPDAVDGFISSEADFRAELENACPRGKAPDVRNIPCAVMFYEPRDPVPGTNKYVMRAVFALNRKGDTALAIWQGKFLPVEVTRLYGNVSMPDLSRAEAAKGVTHDYYPVGLMSQAEYQSCKCLTFGDKSENPFGRYRLPPLPQGWP